MNAHVEIDAHWCLEQLLPVLLSVINYWYKRQIDKKEMASITVDCAF